MRPSNYTFNNLLHRIHPTSGYDHVLRSPDCLQNINFRICSLRISFCLRCSLQRFLSVFHRFFKASATWRCVPLMHNFMRNLLNCSRKCQNWEGMVKYATTQLLEPPQKTFLLKIATEILQGRNFIPAGFL